MARNNFNRNASQIFSTFKPNHFGARFNLRVGITKIKHLNFDLIFKIFQSTLCHCITQPHGTFQNIFIKYNLRRFTCKYNVVHYKLRTRVDSKNKCCKFAIWTQNNSWSFDLDICITIIKINSLEGILPIWNFAFDKWFSAVKISGSQPQFFCHFRLRQRH